MNKKKKYEVANTPYAANPKISVIYELPFLRDVIKPGDKIKFKNDRSLYVFVRLAHNEELDSTWIDCYEFDTKITRSFHVAKLKSVVRPKVSRRRKKIA